MKIEEIKETLATMGTLDARHDDVLDSINACKVIFLKEDAQDILKELWICEQIAFAHKIYIEAFSLIKENNFFEGWKKLETVEITLLHLKKHFSFPQNQHRLLWLENKIISFQTIFPYRLFSSIELLEKKKKCSICDLPVSIRNPCGHTVGEIYNGEMCCRIVTEAEVLGIALVENPGNKYSVMFVVNEETKEQVEYNYSSLEYLIEHINGPYDYWDVEIEKRPLPLNFFKGAERNKACPCGAEEKYKKCCFIKPKEYVHHEFILEHPSEKTVFTL